MRLERATIHNINANNGSPKTVDLVFYMDKNEKACDLRDIVVCFKENTYYVVKDICVHRDVLVQKFLFGEKGYVKCSSNSNKC